MSTRLPPPKAYPLLYTKTDSKLTARIRSVDSVEFYSQSLGSRSIYYSSEIMLEVATDDSYDIALQPETRPVSPEQLAAEVRGIYAGLVMVEAKCIGVDQRLASLTQSKLSN